MNNKNIKDKNVSCILIDISGVLKEGGKVIESSKIGFEKLIHSKIPQILCTNDSGKTNIELSNILNKGGINVDSNLIYTPTEQCINYVTKNNLKPFINSNNIVKNQFKRKLPHLFENELNSEQEFYNNIKIYDSVVISDQEEILNYQNFNKSFRILQQSNQPVLLTMGYNQFQRASDGFLNIDNYGLVRGLRDSVKEARDSNSRELTFVIGGKPNSDYFKSAISNLNKQWNTYFRLEKNNIVMIGDDLYGDVIGSIDAGLNGVLVRTGKQSLDWESKTEFVQNNFYEFIEQITE